MNSPLMAIRRRTVGVVMGTASVLGRLAGEARAVGDRTLRHLGLDGMPFLPSPPQVRSAPPARHLGLVAVDESVDGDGSAGAGGVNVERALKLVGALDPATSTSPKATRPTPRSDSGAKEAIAPRQRRR
ncbi:hypothetical protein [Mycobacterium sp. URHB0044]|jgi:hypothetical protein|uniref:hypothetical protein n=1 Tax=Mycobacterium sp. URHB0044 TaxID=1380386 RepID=UPI0012DF25FC|nr:hypothetical protein [Mycobacterium sp. URHB0044]